MTGHYLKESKSKVKENKEGKQKACTQLQVQVWYTVIYVPQSHGLGLGWYRMNGQFDEVEMVSEAGVLRSCSHV